jgi:hypothetical protein
MTRWEKNPLDSRAMKARDTFEPSNPGSELLASALIQIDGQELSMGEESNSYAAGERCLLAKSAIV